MRRHSGRAQRDPGSTPDRRYGSGLRLRRARNDDSQHFLLQDFREAVEAVLCGNLAEHGLLDQRHAVGVDLAAPAGIGEVRADDTKRKEFTNPASEGSLANSGRLRDRLARRQQAER